MPFIRRTLVFSTLLVAACSSDPESPAPDEFPLEPNPANVTVTLQIARAVSATVPLTGGTLTATGTDGTVYTLTVPNDALLNEVTITMTPLASITGLGVSGGRHLGVHLAPDGLEFFNPVTLRVAPPDGANVSAVGFSAHGMGAEVHQSPLTTDPTRLEMKLMHFSVEFVSMQVVPLEAAVPTDWLDQLDFAMARVARQERDFLLAGGTEERSLFFDRMEGILDEFWTIALEPILNRMQTDCAYAKQNMRIATGWAHKVSMFGLDARFASEHSRITSTLIAAIQNCWGENLGACLNETNQVQMHEAISYTRSLTLLGALEARYDAGNTSLYCRDWVGTFTATGPTVHGPAETVTAQNVSFELDPANSSPGSGLFYYRVRQGTLSWSIAAGTSTPRNCPVAAAQATFTMQPTDGYFRLDQSTSSPTYTGGGAINAFGTAIESCPGQPARTLVFPVGTWFFTGAFPVPAGAQTLSGSVTFEGRSYQWTLTRGGAAATP